MSNPIGGTTWLTGNVKSAATSMTKGQDYSEMALHREQMVFSDLPLNWICPNCQMGKEYFCEMVTDTMQEPSA